MKRASKMGSGNRFNDFTVVRVRNEGRREFFQHDDRGYENQSSSNYAGRSRFESGRGRGGWQGQNNERGYSRGSYRGYRGSRRGQPNRRYLDNNDVSMSEAGSGKGRHQDYYENARGRGGRGYRGNKYNRAGKFFNLDALWHKITIHDTNKKDEVMELIKANVDDIFSPTLVMVEQNNVVFYLEKQAHIAKAIWTLSNRINLNNGRKLHIACSETAPPVKKPTDEQIQVVIKVMSERYGIEMKRLDLKNFHNDSTLVKEGIFCPLYRNVVLSAVLEIIVSHIPNVEEIDFSNNQLTTLNELEVLKDCENLKRLNLEHNRLKYEESFQKLKCLLVEEISLIGNPFKSTFQDSKSYKTAISRLFPKARILDGVELERPIGFAVETEEFKVPKEKPSFFCSEEAKALILQFLEQYYQVFESDDRRALAAAYTADAMFSLTANFPEAGNGSKFAQVYVRENRNLKFVQTQEMKHRLLSKGREDVIDTICKLPVVNHDPSSFTIDIPIAQPRLIHVMLMGVFKQIVGDQSPVRSFLRSLIVVPVGEGFCISNEELFVNVATVDQIRKSFRAPPDTPANSPAAPGPSASIVMPAVSQDAALDTTLVGLKPAQIELIKQFAITSKMLPQYCRLCLEQNDWDFSKAGEMFLGLQRENKIPPEYFGLAT